MQASGPTRKQTAFREPIHIQMIIKQLNTLIWNYNFFSLIYMLIMTQLQCCPDAERDAQSWDSRHHKMSGYTPSYSIFVHIRSEVVRA